MKFQFESMAEFMLMNGHGPYVWASYAITFMVLIYLLLSPLLQHKSFIKRQQKLHRLGQGKAPVDDVDS